jgi:mannose-1-phosphate guanylyltransferase
MEYYAIIMSGGRGKRLWPFSQVSLPKQFQRFVGETTLFQQTYQRLRQVMPADHIYTVTRSAYRPIIFEQVGEFLPENIIVEPSQKNTGPCIALGTAYIHHREPGATIVVLPADHHISGNEAFAEALEAGLSYAASTRDLVTFGIRPEYPHTGYGYIQVGDLVKSVHGLQVHRVRRFVEKPDLETATRLVATQEYYWNSGIFCWQAGVILEAFEQLLPRIYERMKKLQSHIGTDTELKMLARVYDQVASISIDKGVMEHSGHVAVLPIDVGWSDVGSWEAVRRLYAPDPNGNLIRGGHVVDRVTGSTIVSQDQQIIVIGLTDVIVASNGGYILVCARNQEHHIQTMVDQIERDTLADI